MSDRPTLLQMWNNCRSSIPVGEMKCGMIYRMAWMAPLDFTQSIETPPDALVMPFAEFRMARDPLGWVLLGRWADRNEPWVALYE